jgi:hypothetical protein
MSNDWLKMYQDKGELATKKGNGVVVFEWVSHGIEDWLNEYKAAEFPNLQHRSSTRITILHLAGTNVGAVRDSVSMA